MVNEWTNAHPPVPLGKGDVHVWMAQLDQSPTLVAQLAPLLVADEQRHADRFHFARDRQRYVVAHAFLRSLLSAYAGVQLAEITLVSGTYGKPYLVLGPGIPDLRFNLSHSQGYALAAVTVGCEVGVDIEYMQPLNDANLIAQNFFSCAERLILSALPPPQHQQAFYTCWARKEAFIKGVGWGLAMPLDKFAVTLAPGVPARLTYLHDDFAEQQGWSLYDLPALPGYATALALPIACHHLMCYTWSPWGIVRAEV